MSKAIRISFAFLLFALLNPVFGDFVYVTFEAVTFADNASVLSSSVCGQFSPSSGDMPSPQPIEVTHFPLSGCNQYSNQKIKLINDNALFILRGNCPFETKIIQAARANAKLLLVASSDPLPIANLNDTIAENYSTPMFIIPRSAFTLVSLTDYSTVSITPLALPAFNLNKILLFFIALVPLIIGSLLGGSHMEFLNYGLLLRKGEVDENNLEKLYQEEEVNCIRERVYLLFYIIFMLAVMVAFLLGLYFFYIYFVWISIVIFCFSSSISMYSFFSPFLAKIPFLTCRVPANNFPLFKYRPDPKFFLLLATSVILPVWWIVSRQSSYAWILQDTLGSFLVVYLLTTLRFNTSISFLIPFLCILVLYDVFFVFISPFFTPDGRSIMEYVAFGPDGGSDTSVPNSHLEAVVPSVFNESETTPFIFLVPHLTVSPGEIMCQYPRLFVAGLGFGDVVLPGLFLTYCLHYDNLRKRTFKLTFLVCFLSYALGLVLAFIISFVAKSGQPALLYLVPSTLVSTLLLTLVRGDFKDFLYGRGTKSKKFLLVEAEYSSEEDSF